MTTLLTVLCCGGAVLASLAALMIIAGLVRKAGGRRWEER
jgi:hypothetical protein